MTGAELTWKLGANTLTWIPAYFHLDWSGNYWLENIPALLTAKYDQVTQELRLTGDPAARWQWLAGLYAYRVTNSGDLIVGGFPLADVERNRLSGVAAFGQATLDVTDRFRFTVGGRVSRDDREGRGATPFGQPFSSDESYDRVDWKLGVEYDARAQSMLYGTVQTAYQPGTYNLFPSTATESNRVAPAKLTSYTVGAKNRFLDDRLQANVEAYYYDYRDLFVQSFNLNTALLTTFNAQKVEIYGTQLDVLYKPVPAGRLNVSVGWLHARNREFVVPANVNIGTPQRDFRGYALQYAPDWTVTAGYQHDFPIGAGYLRARARRRATRARSGARSCTRAARGRRRTSRATPRSRTTARTRSGARGSGSATSRTSRCSRRRRRASSPRTRTRSSRPRARTARGSLFRFSAPPRRRSRASRARGSRAYARRARGRPRPP